MGSASGFWWLFAEAVPCEAVALADIHPNPRCAVHAHSLMWPGICKCGSSRQSVAWKALRKCQLAWGPAALVLAAVIYSQMLCGVE